ncbi:ABC transporter permease [Ureibacillus acetophenoni]|uniref:Peptide/nickel transport system permease protein n=1 Tax=Ureibacillus acetophenoni TaxID=614649 RepID=A0A285UG63_9BACL|nr:ABC transporter permease [Ureibacillus acetophenoni]SOC40895.1 peptide/nickel transport system permease protein [Ureibacillus acetophenoni]
MAGYIIRRLFSLIPVLAVVAIVVFLIIHITPGDPAAMILGEGASPEQIEELRHEMGLDQPIVTQFFLWLTNVFKGDFGDSYFLGKSVLQAFWENLGPTVSLAILAQIIGVTLALVFGIIAARYRGTRLDELVMGGSLFGISVPSFLLGSILILLFSVQLKIFPVSGYQPLSEGLGEHLKYLILPGITLGIMQAALITRMTRSSLLDVLSENFIKTAKAKGLKEKSILLGHALRVAFLPILTVIGESFGGLVTGAAVTEALFNIPGLGQLIISGISRRDYPLLQGSILLITVVYVLINLIVDLLYAVIDPRVRNSYRS